MDNFEELKKEVDEAHKRFFEKRGINPHQADFLFGDGSLTNYANNLSLSSYQNDQPTSQSFLEKSQNRASYE